MLFELFEGTALSAAILLLCGCGAEVFDTTFDSPLPGVGSAPTKSDDGAASEAGDGFAIVRFSGGFADPVVAGTISAGEPVRVIYELDRMRDVLEWSNGSGSFLADAHGCYGDGCCQVDFPTARVHYRFSDYDAFTEEILTEGETTLYVPAAARQVELFFDTPGYSVKAWECGCDQACAEANYESAKTQDVEKPSWDSRYGANYRFDVAPQASITTVVFGANLSEDPTVTGPLDTGAPARIQFDRGRFFDIIDWSVKWGTYWESAHHCYGYGCCEVKFPEVTAHIRYSEHGEWEHHALDTADGVTVDIPSWAERLDVWFDVPGYSVKAWYCGCNQECADESWERSEWQEREYQAWDSRFAKNYFFNVLQ